MKHLTLSLLLLTALSVACDRRTYSQSTDPTPTPVPSPSEDPQHLYDVYEGDTLLHHGYEISCVKKTISYEYPDGTETPTKVSYAVVKKDNKIVAKFDAELDHPMGYHTEFGRFDILGDGTQPVIISSTARRDGRHWVISLYPEFRVLFDSGDYGVGREEFYVIDVDKDGVYEISLEVTAFYQMQDKMYIGEIPLPQILFKYDATRKKYFPANHVHADYALRGLEAAVRALNNEDKRYFSLRLRILLRYIYAGRQEEGWAFFEKAYQRPDKKEMTARVKEVLRDSPLYKFLYPKSHFVSHNIAPKQFQHIDFNNHAYGINLQLTNGEYNFEGGGWVSLRNVYYADLNGDNVPEAIVMLSVVHCGGSCDGGSALFYIYEARKKGLQRIWNYETGSAAYGCGLKSFAARPKQIVMEVFGRCRRPKQESPEPGKFLVKDMTRLTFKLKGRRFVRRNIEFIPTAVNDTKNYKPEIVVENLSARLK